jgi:hypothetical protein
MWRASPKFTSVPKVHSGAALGPPGPVEGAGIARPGKPGAVIEAQTRYGGRVQTGIMPASSVRQETHYPFSVSLQKTKRQFKNYLNLPKPPFAIYIGACNTPCLASMVRG